jgi:hypothetical protein
MPLRGLRKIPLLDKTLDLIRYYTEFPKLFAVRGDFGRILPSTGRDSFAATPVGTVTGWHDPPRTAAPPGIPGMARRLLRAR